MTRPNIPLSSAQAAPPLCGASRHLDRACHVHKISAKATLWVAAALAGFALARLAPPLAGLTPLGQSVLGAAFAGTMLWVSEAIPLGIPPWWCCCCSACPGTAAGRRGGRVRRRVVFFLIGAVALGTAVEESGLAARAARFLSPAPAAAPTRLYVQMIAGFPVLALLDPFGHHAQRHPDPCLSRRAGRHGRRPEGPCRRAPSCWRSACSIRWPHRRS